MDAARKKYLPLMLMSLCGGLGAFGCSASASSKANSMHEGMAVMRRESNPTDLAQRGEAFAALGDMTRAEQYFVAALKAGGESGSLVRRLIAVCVADSRYPVALDYAEDYLRNHPADVEVRFAMATVRAALGDVEGAREGLRSVLIARPALADAHYALAQLEKGQGDVMAADVEYRKYLTLVSTGQRADVARSNLMQSVPQ